MQYYLSINSLEGCPFSIGVESLLQQHDKIPNEINKISQLEKHRFKNDDISTFPQVYLKKYNSKGSILLGGNSDFKELLEISKIPNLDIQLEKLTKKYPRISKKVKLRIIEIFNL